MGLGTLTLLGLLLVPGQSSPDILPFNHPKIEIPIRYDPAKKNEIKDLLLFVSPDQGITWQQHAVAVPDRDAQFVFNAQADGIYWFNMVVVDKQGRRDPADIYKAGAALKVLIDTKKPILNIKSAERTGDDVTVVWDIQERNPNWTKFRLDYKSNDGAWVPVHTRPEANGSAQFRVTTPSAIAVRLSLTDAAENGSEMVKEVPGVSTSVATNPAATTPTNPMNSGHTSFSKVPATPPTDIMRVDGREALSPPPAPVDPLSEIRSPLAPAASVPAVGNVIGESADRSKVREGSTTLDPLAPTKGPDATSTVPTSTPGGAPLPKADVINITHFNMAYDIEQRGPSGISRAEVYVTRDDGKSWIRWTVAEKPESPIAVELATRNNPQVEGLYGFKVVLHSGAGLSKGPPVSGDMPDMRVDVDITPPLVKIYEPIADPAQKDTMILRWQAVDRNLANDPISLEWAEQLEGPWSPIASAEGIAASGSSTGAIKRMPNTGSYSWKIPANFPTHRVYLKVTARDIAGNVAEAKTGQPILVDLNKPVAKIQGIIGAAGQK